MTPSFVVGPRSATDPNLDKRDMYRTNHEATRLAIRRALAGEPSNARTDRRPPTIRHDMDDGRRARPRPRR